MKRFLPLLLTLASLVGYGQQANVTLDVKPSDGQRQVRQDYTLQQAQTTFKNWYARAKVLGWTDQQFLDQSMFVAKWQQLQYFSSSLGPNAPTASTVNVTVPEGYYYQTDPIELGRGTYRGSGTFAYYNGNYTTTLAVWHEKWRDPNVPRDLIHTSNHGLDTWWESGRVEGFRLDGRAAMAVLPDPSFKSTGLVIWDGGENCHVEYIYAHNFNTAGIEFVRGTPVEFETLSVFSNCWAGLLLTGTAQNTIVGLELSADDNDAAVRQGAGYGRDAGGAVFIGLIKNEGGVSEGRVKRPQKLAVLAGQTGFVVGVAKSSQKAARVANLIEIDCRLTNGTPQVSNIQIGSVSGFGFDNIIYDVTHNWKAKARPDNYCYSFEYTSEFGGKVFNPFFTFEGAPNGGTVPPVTPVDPPVNPPTTAKWAKTYTSPTTASTKVAVPAGVNPINETRLVNVKFSNLNIAFVNSHLLLGQGGTLWKMVGTSWVDTGIKVTVGQALNVSVPMAGTTLTNVIGGAGATCVMTGTIQVL